MGKASTTKKIQRVQRAGTTKVAGQRRPLGFPLAVIAIIVVGSVLVWLARDSKVGQAAESPVANADHWHYAYGFYKCDSYPDALQKLPDGASDPLGIHTHADGLIHIHPFSTGVAGKRAVFKAFADQVGLEVSDDEVTFPAAVGSEVWKSGSTCDIDKKKEKAVLKAFVWPPQANDKVKPEVITSNIANVRFTEDGGTIVIALVPEDTTTIPLPASIEQLKDPLAAEGGGEQSPTGTPTTVVTQEGATTTAPPADSSSTTAPAGDTAETIPSAPSTTEAP